MAKRVFERPPLGVMPRWLWLEHRRDELRSAMQRYIDAKVDVPYLFVKELEEILPEIDKEISASREASALKWNPLKDATDSTPVVRRPSLEQGTVHPSE